MLWLCSQIAREGSATQFPGTSILAFCSVPSLPSSQVSPQFSHPPPLYTELRTIPPTSNKSPAGMRGREVFTSAPPQLVKYIPQNICWIPPIVPPLNTHPNLGVSSEKHRRQVPSQSQGPDFCIRWYKRFSEINALFPCLLPLPLLLFQMTATS